MKNILNQLKFVPIVFIFVFIPKIAFGQAFITNQFAQFALNSNQTQNQATIGGSVSMGDSGIPINSMEVRVVQVPGNVTNYTGNFNNPITTITGPDLAFSTGGVFSNVILGGFDPITQYTFVFRLTNSLTNQIFDTKYFTAISLAIPSSGGGPGGGGPGPGGGPGTNPPVADPGMIDPLNDSTGSYEWPANVIPNTLSVEDINSFIVGLLNALLKIGIPILVLFFVYSGLKFVMARGNEKELEEAKKNLLWVIIGGAILLGSWTIVKVLKGTIDQIEITSIYQIINYFV